MLRKQKIYYAIVIVTLIVQLLLPSASAYNEYFSSGTSDYFDLDVTTYKDLIYHPKGNSDFGMCVYNSPYQTTSGFQRHFYNSGTDPKYFSAPSCLDCKWLYDFTGYGEFYYLGTAYTKFYIVSHGYVDLDNNPVIHNGAFSNFGDNTFLKKKRIAGYLSDTYQAAGQITAWIERGTATNSIIIQYLAYSYNGCCYIRFQMELKLGSGAGKGDISMYYGTNLNHPARIGLALGSAASDYEINIDSLIDTPAMSFTHGTRTSTSLGISYTAALYAQHYYVTCKRVSDNALIWSTTTDSTSVTATGLTPGTAYYFTVQKSCVKWDGSTYITPTIRTSTQGTTLPATVTAISATSTTNSVSFNWSPPAGGPYNYKCVLNTGTTTYALNGQTSCSFTGLNAVTTYTVKIHSGVGSDYDTAYAERAVMTRPSPVTNFLRTAVDVNSMTISWSSANGNLFNIQLLSGTTSVASALGWQSTSYTFTNLNPGVTYTIFVYAGTAAAGYEGAGASEVFKTLPSPPSDLTLSGREGTTLTFTWTPTAGYVYSLEIVAGKSQSGLNSGPVTLTSLSLSTSYTVRLRIGQGSSYSSTYTELTRSTYGGVVTNIQLTGRTSNSLSFSWTGPPGAVRYLVSVGGKEAAVETNSYTFTGLSGYTTYTATIKSGFNVDAHETTGATSTPTRTLVAVATGVTRTGVDTNSMTFQWVAPNGATTFNVKLVGDQTYQKTVSAATATFDNLASNANYQLTVFSGNSDGYENVGTPTASFKTLPAAPGAVNVLDVTTGSITVGWTSSAGATKYQAYINGGSMREITTPLQTTFTGLAPVQSYTIEIRAGNNDGYQSVGRTVTQTTSTSSVSNLHTIEVTASSIKFGWNLATAALGYRLVFTPGTHDVVYLGDSGKEYEYTGLTAGSTYTITVTAGFNDPINYNNETSVSASATTIPPAPGVITVATRTSSTMLSFSWSPVPGASFYSLTLTAEGVTPIDVISTATNREFTSLIAGLQYTLVVKAGNNYGTETTGSLVSVYTLPPVATGLTVDERSSNSLSFSWDGHALANKFKIRLWTGGMGVGTPTETTVDVEEYIKEGLSANTLYVLEVVSGIGEEFDTLSVSVSGKTLPAPTTLVQVSSTTSIAALISWTLATGADQYKLVVTNEDNNTPLPDIVVRGGLSYLLNNLTPNTEYSLVIYSGVFDLDLFEGVGKTLDSFKTRPDVVLGLTCSETTTNSFKVVWTAPDGATRFNVGHQGKLLDIVTTTSQPFSGLTPATAYTIVVFSGNAEGFESVGATISCLTLTLPPTGLTITGATSSTLSFRWTQVATANAYRAELLQGSTVVFSQNLGNVDTVLFESLPADTAYTCKVFAGILNAGFESVGVTLATEAVRTTPEPPTDLTVTELTRSSIKVSWTGAPGATGYRTLLYREGELFTSTTLGIVENTEFGSLDPFTNYTVTIRSINAGGTEPVGASVDVATRPGLVNQLAVLEVTNTMMKVGWGAPAGAEAFRADILLGNTIVDSVPLDVGSDPLEAVFSVLQASTEHTIRVHAGTSLSELDTLYTEIKHHTLSDPLDDVKIVSATSNSITIELDLTEGTTGIAVQLRNSTGDVIDTKFITEFSRRRAISYGILEDLSPNTEYNMEFLTISPGGTGITGPTETYSTFPTPVTGFVGAGSGSNANFTWNAVAGATSYMITRYNATTLDKIDSYDNITSTSYSYSGLSSGINYRFQIVVCKIQNPPCASEGPFIIVNTKTVICAKQTFDGISTFEPISSGNNRTGTCKEGFAGTPVRTCVEASGKGTWSSPIGACIELPAPVPSVTATPYHSSIQVKWDKAPRATRYRVLYKTTTILDGDDWSVAVEDVTGLTYTIPNLEVRVEYTIAVLAGNAGGYEVVGLETTVTTTLQPPIQLTVSSVTSNSASLSWGQTFRTQFYRISIKRPGATAFEVIGTAFDITYVVKDLEASTNYEILVQSGSGFGLDEYVEPNGSKVTVTTEVGDGQVVNDNNLPMIIGIACGIGLLALLVIVVGVYLFLKSRKKSTELHKSQQDLLSMYSLQRTQTSDQASFIPNPGFYNTMQSSLTNFSGSMYDNASMSRIATVYSMGGGVDNATLMNTMMEISVPGFLKLDLNTQLRVDDKVGTGGTGTVSIGELIDPALVEQHQVKTVAIKEVHPWSSLSMEENKERFLQEVSVIWSVTFHINVMKLIGYTEEPMMTIVTRYYETDLYRYLQDPSNPMTSGAALSFTRGICDGMAAINNCGIVHRDVKSANILLEKGRDHYGNMLLRPIICDFGLARIFRDVRLENQKFIAMTGISPRYAAPEVFERITSKTVAPDIVSEIKSDVYALGIIIWEMLSRQVPWEGLQPKEIEGRVRGGERPKLPDYCTNMEILSQDRVLAFLTELMEFCWSGQPTMRPTFMQLVQRMASVM